MLGPVAVGRHALMVASGLPIAAWKTSQPPKPSDPERSYYDLSRAANRNALLERLGQGAFIDVEIHPVTGELQTLEPAAFTPDTLNLVATTVKAYKKIKQSYSIGSLTDIWGVGAVCVLPSSYGEWQEQWFEQEGGTPPNYEARVAEALDCMAFCLADPHMGFVVNSDIAQGGLALQDIALHGQASGERESGRAVASTFMGDLVASGLHGSSREAAS